MKPLKLASAALLLALVGWTGAWAQATPPRVSPSAGPPAVPIIRAPSGANLNISPKRVALDRTHRTATVFIFNQGAAAGTFDISLVDRVMLPDGRILALSEAADDPAAKAIADQVKSARPILQVSPRRVTLGPGQGQTIRLRVSGAPEDPAAVELRTHLTIASLPPREAGTTAEEAAAAPSAGGLQFQINALLGLSIPAIVRLGDVDVRAKLENAKLAPRPPSAGVAPDAPGAVLSVDLVRVGANSLFGNLEVRPQGQPRGPPMGIVRGLGVYTEIDRRTVQIPLGRAPLEGERLEVTFTDDDTAPGKQLAKLDF